MENIIIVGFSGACNSGKTNFFNKIKKLRSSYVDFLPEKIRENIRENESIDDLRKDANRFLDMQDSIFNFNLKSLNDIKNKNNYKNRLVITDRTLIDNLYYTLIYLNRNYDTLNWNKHNKLWEDMLTVASKIENYYTNIFLFTPIPFKDRIDKNRVKNYKDIQNLEYNTIKLLYHKNIDTTKSVYNNSNFIIDFDVIEMEKQYDNPLVCICNSMLVLNKNLNSEQKKLLKTIISEQTK